MDLERECYIIHHIPRDSVFYTDDEQASISTHDSYLLHAYDIYNLIPLGLPEERIKLHSYS